MRFGIALGTAIICASMGFTAPCPADSIAHSASIPAARDSATVNIGGLALVPAKYRYRPVRASLPATPFVAPADITSRNRLTVMHSDLEYSYVADRSSLLNRIRSRRGLALITFWETAERCLFFGLNDRGLPGLSFVQRRSLSIKPAFQDTSQTRALYAEMTDQRLGTFPQAPSIMSTP